MSIDTTKVSDRRTLRFESLDAALTDAERLVKQLCRTLGNWTLGQNLDHLARTVRIGFEGPHILASWFARILIAPFVKKRFITKSMPAGFQFTKQMEPYRPEDQAVAVAALEELRKQYSRLSRESPSVPHPFLGPLTHEEWLGMHLRHAELHLSFLVPEAA